MKTVFVVCFLVLVSMVHAGDTSLSKETSVPTGERVANYLQSVVAPASGLVSAKSQGDLFSSSTRQDFSFNYDPENQVINVDVVGGSEDFESAKKVLDLTQQLIFSLNKKIQKYYGVTLTTDDLAMVYINAKAGTLLAKFEKGQYESKFKGPLFPTPTPYSGSGNINP